jgi:UDP-glucuronate decarboxylase
MDYHRAFNLDIRIVRIFNTYGPAMDPEDGRAISNFVVQALKNEDITIQGDGTQTRSFQYIDDLLKALTKMMNNEKGFVGPVNLGNPEEFTIRELAALVMALVPNSKSRVIYLPLPEDDPMRRRPDISLAKEMLDWEPRVKLKDGLKPTIKYFSDIISENCVNENLANFNFLNGVIR